MRIHNLTRQASVELLERAQWGRLACACQGQPYITPINYAYEDNYLYSFSTIGQKITWMRGNPMVCVEVEEVTSPQNWATVIVFGNYEELLAHDAHRKHAYDLLQRRPVWWEPGGVAAPLRERTHTSEFAFFRIYIDRVSGRRSVPEPYRLRWSVKHLSALRDGCGKFSASDGYPKSDCGRRRFSSHPGY